MNSGTLRASILLGAGLFVAGLGCSKSNTYVEPPPPEVSVANPLRAAVVSYLEHTGTTKSVQSVELRARVKGFLQERKFVEGDQVNAGDLLFVIDEAPFKQAVQNAKAKFDEAEAALKKAEQSKSREVAKAQVALDQASLKFAQAEEIRERRLLERNADTKENYDRVVASLAKAVAQVDASKASELQASADYDTGILSAKAQVEAAKAQLKNAEIDLGYCRISAPIAGRITRGRVDPGNLVGDGLATLLAEIVSLDPIHAYFTASETDVLRFREMVRNGSRVDYRKEAIPIDLGMANEPGFPHTGKLDYVDPAIDPSTGTTTARAVFANPGSRIIPGLFVRIRVPFESLPNALVVPERAIGTDQIGKFLLVVNHENVVDRRSVRVGALAGEGLRVIAEGLVEEDRVVVNGTQRARPGAKVKPEVVALSAPAGPAVTAAPEARSSIPPKTDAK